MDSDGICGTTGRRRALRLGALVLGFVALTVLMTWPLAPRAGSSVQDLGDPLFEIWTLRWDQHQLVHDPGHIWDGNIFYPFRLSLLFSEAQLSTGVIAWPVQLLTGNDVLAYNLVFLGTFVLLGVGMALLVEEITGNLAVGLLAGVLAAFAPYRYGHLSHLHVLVYGWIPLALWALARLARRGRAGNAALVSLFLTIQILASDTVTTMALGMVGLAVLVLLGTERCLRRPRRLSALAAGFAAPALALAFTAHARLEANRAYGFARDLDTVRKMSARPLTYLSVTAFNHFWSGVLPHAYPSALFPGAVTLLGAALGLSLGTRRWPRWAGYGAAAGVGAFVLSLGPDTDLGGRRVPLPYGWLYDHVPGITSQRDVARLGTVVLLSLAILAGIGFAATWAVLRPRLPARQAVRIGAALVVLLGAAALIEFRSTVGTVPVPRDHAAVAVYDWLAHEPAGPVIELPYNGPWTDLMPTIRQTYYSARDWHPLVNGYSGFMPQRYLDFLVALQGDPRQPSLVNADNVGLLQDIGVRYLVVDHVTTPGYDWQRAIAAADAVPVLHRVGDVGKATAYTLDASARLPVRYSLEAPSTAAPGATYPAVLLVHNDNPNLAVTTLDTLPAATVRWTDASGQVVASQSVPVRLPAGVASGLSSELVAATAPAAAGRYRVRLGFGTLASPIEEDVTVREPAAEQGGPAVALRGASWDPRTYRPGEIVDVRLEWDVRRPLPASYAVTAQLLTPDDRLFAQQDGYPYDGQLPTTRWVPGMTIVQVVAVHIPPGAPPGPARLLVALYDPGQPGLPRLTIALPGGATASQGLFGPVSVAEP